MVETEITLVAAAACGAILSHLHVLGFGAKDFRPAENFTGPRPLHVGRAVAWDGGQVGVAGLEGVEDGITLSPFPAAAQQMSSTPAITN